MKLSNVSFLDLSVGDRVRSAKGTPGAIVKLHDYRRSTGQLDDDNSISFSWENGEKSFSVYHKWCSEIDYLET